MDSGPILFSGCLQWPPSLQRLMHQKLISGNILSHSQSYNGGFMFCNHGKYADSTRSLDELEMICECMNTGQDRIFPVFDQVEPAGYHGVLLKLWSLLLFMDRFPLTSTLPFLQPEDWNLINKYGLVNLLRVQIQLRSFAGLHSLMAPVSAAYKHVFFPYHGSTIPISAQFARFAILTMEAPEILISGHIYYQGVLLKLWSLLLLMDRFPLTSTLPFLQPEDWNLIKKSGQLVWMALKKSFESELVEDIGKFVWSKVIQVEVDSTMSA
ncbi:hypothetical protein ACLB2K_030489 [Fragaria x ananassa]